MADPVPAVCECPSCGRLVTTVRGNFTAHSTYPTGPECGTSRQRVTAEAIANTGHIKRMEQVLLWAHMLRDEDPAHVQRWIATSSRVEVEALLLTALAAINPDQTINEAFGWLSALS